MGAQVNTSVRNVALAGTSRQISLLSKLEWYCVDLDYLHKWAKELNVHDLPACTLEESKQS